MALFQFKTKKNKYVYGKRTDALQRDFMITFLNQLPTEELKKLVSFKEIDYEDKELYNDPKNIDLLEELKQRGDVQLEAKINI